MQCWKMGDNRLNDHTKMCREKRDKKRAENDKIDEERALKKTIKPTKMYTLLMDEGIKNEEKELEELKKNALKKQQQKRERRKKSTRKHTRGSTKNKRNIHKRGKG